jgi:peptidoglycan/LPS O-acetylase OafA/YrhL
MNQIHLYSLTWLRALAAFFVVISHSAITLAAQYSPTDLPITFTLPLGSLGTFSVSLFFALSGCTLTLSNQNNSFNTILDFLKFYIKRFFRIWPTFAFSMLVYLIFIEFFKETYLGDNHLWIAQITNEYTALNVIQYLSLTFNITGPSDLFAAPYWSLPVEFQYYLLLPFALLLMSNRERCFLIPMIFGGVLYMLYSKNIPPIDRKEVFMLAYTFFGGVLLAKAYLSFTFRLPVVIATSLFVIVILLVELVAAKIIIIPKDILFLSDTKNYFSTLAVICLSLVIFSKPITLPNKLSLFLTEYGDISYSIYLFHMLFVCMSAIILTRLDTIQASYKFIIVFLLPLILSFYFSRFTYKYIETPSINLGRRLSRNLT